jgi:predicted nucleotidyltransferase
MIRSGCVLHEKIVRAEKELGLDLKSLREAAELSDTILGQARSRLVELHAPDSEIDVVVFGSLARRELSARSDLDYVVVAHSLPRDIRSTRKLLEVVEQVQGELELRGPGATGMFGSVISAPDLIERIGLEEDTNLNHSRRILLLEESCSIYREDLHRSLLKAMLERYLIDYDAPKMGVPRFLLNDVIRYWRTLAVDYQAKRWIQGKRFGQKPKWGLRFFKLLVSRKLAFAATVTSILLTEDATVDYYLDQFTMPALARLAQLYDRLEDDRKEDLGTVLQVAEEFSAKLADASFRDRAEAFESPAEIERDEILRPMRKRCRDLEGALERLFFETECLGKRSVRYLVF